MLIEISIEYREQNIFTEIFDTRGSETFADFRRDFHNRFARKHPHLSLDDPQFRETWRQIHASRRRIHKYVTV